MTFPTLKSRIEDGNTRRFEFEIAEDLIWFRGHFSGFPVLPGVVQLRWAVELAQENFGFKSGPREVMRLKFKSIVVPPITVELTLTQLAPGQVRFGYSGRGQEYSQGKLIFSESTQ